jgi:hypothetical protein
MPVGDDGWELNRLGIDFDVGTEGLTEQEMRPHEVLLNYKRQEAALSNHFDFWMF